MLFNEKKVIERLYIYIYVSVLWITNLYIRTQQEFSEEGSEDLCSDNFLGHREDK